MLFVFLYLLTLVTPVSSTVIKCHMTDAKTGADQTCFGQYCLYSKTTSEDGDTTITQGCFNFASDDAVNQRKLDPVGLGQHQSCYKVFDVPNTDKSNGLYCICGQKDYCNTDQLMNTIPAPAQPITCQHSESNATCQGYGCVTVFRTKVGGAHDGAKTVERYCQDLGDYRRNPKIATLRHAGNPLSALFRQIVLSFEGVNGDS